MSQEVERLLSPARLISHSALKIQAPTGYTLYVDPYELSDAPHDADAVLVTHEHFDHFSPEDIAKIAKEGTLLVAPASVVDAIEKSGMTVDKAVVAGDAFTLAPDVSVEVVAAYNVLRPFHTQDKAYVGYVVEAGGIRYFHMGDTDLNPDNEQVSCDVLFIPVGGTYTMDAEEAVTCTLAIHPKVAVPMHYGTAVGTPEDGPRFASLLQAAQRGVEDPIPSVLMLGA